MAFGTVISSGNRSYRYQSQSIGSLQRLRGVLSARRQSDRRCARLPRSLTKEGRKDGRLCRPGRSFLEGADHIVSKMNPLGPSQHRPWLFRGQQDDWNLMTTIERALYRWGIELNEALAVEFQTISRISTPFGWGTGRQGSRRHLVLFGADATSRGPDPTLGLHLLSICSGRFRHGEWNGRPYAGQLAPGRFLDGGREALNCELQHTA
jgi:hypothetical protein